MILNVVCCEWKKTKGQKNVDNHHQIWDSRDLRSYLTLTDTLIQTVTSWTKSSSLYLNTFSKSELYLLRHEYKMNCIFEFTMFQRVKHEKFFSIFENTGNKREIIAPKRYGPLKKMGPELRYTIPQPRAPNLPNKSVTEYSYRPWRKKPKVK